MRLWDVATGDELRRIDAHAGDVNWVAFSPDGGTLATGADDKLIKIWDRATGSPGPGRSRGTRLGGGLAFTPDGKHLGSGGHDERVILWDLATGPAVDSQGGPGGADREPCHEP